MRTRSPQVLQRMKPPLWGTLVSSMVYWVLHAAQVTFIP